MKAHFEAIKIAHISLSDINDISFLEKNNFVVLWWKEIPLGHLWLKAQKPLTAPELRILAANAIEPAVKHYCDQCGEDNDGWKDFLKMGELTLLSNFLSNHIKRPNFPVANGRQVDRISVVVCTRNRSEWLKGCIDA